MKYQIYLIGLLLMSTLPVSGCSMQEVQKYAYNTGAAVACRQENDNLPNEAQLNLICLQQPGAGELSYEEYIELKDNTEDLAAH